MIKLIIVILYNPLLSSTISYRLNSKMTAKLITNHKITQIKTTFNPSIHLSTKVDFDLYPIAYTNTNCASESVKYFRNTTCSVSTNFERLF